MRAILYSREAQKALDRIPVNEASRSRAKIKQFAEDPLSLANNVKALTGLPFVRLRVGNWRVIMDDRGRVLGIVKIGPRGGIYD
jgi:mRNA interferase RelE/StbE